MIDHRGNVYKTRNFPENVHIVVTKWKKPIIAPEIKFGLALTYSRDFYVGLSLDLLRAWELYLGTDIGVSRNWKFMAGVHLRYKILTVGYDFLNSGVYFGAIIRW